MISQPFWYLGIVDTNVLKTRNEDYQLIPRVPPCPKRFALFLTNSFWSIKSMIGGQNGFLAEYYNLNAMQGKIWKPWLLGSKSVCLSVCLSSLCLDPGQRIRCNCWNPAKATGLDLVTWSLVRIIFQLLRKSSAQQRDTRRLGWSMVILNFERHTLCSARGSPADWAGCRED